MENKEEFDLRALRLDWMRLQVGENCLIVLNISNNCNEVNKCSQCAFLKTTDMLKLSFFFVALSIEVQFSVLRYVT